MRPRLLDWLVEVPHRAIACSGGVDSVTLATVAHRASPDTTLIVHSITPAVPAAATARVLKAAVAEGWDLRTVRSGEFQDERYVSNPRDRCFVCKSHLYDAMTELVAAVRGPHVLLSGANVDDLGEYRPGLRAAAEAGVRHPFVEVGATKREIRAVARELHLDCADLPASPCLASRLYTGTAVTPARLHAVEVGEALLTVRTGVRVVRCRLREDEVRIEVQDADDGCAPVARAAVYVWHCDRDGGYSMYSEGVENENYLRGVQEAGDDGVVTFTSIFPACYPGRWPHVHFEVFPSLEAATDDANKVATSQIALPEDACAAVYATAGYEQSIQTLAGISLERDNVFGEDGGAQQLGKAEGSAEAGYTVTLAVPVRA